MFSFRSVSHVSRYARSLINDSESILNGAPQSFHKCNDAMLSTSSAAFGIRGKRRLEYKRRKEPAVPIVPPKLTTPLQEMYNTKVMFRKARKTRSPSPKPHVFREPERSWNLRQIPTEEEAKEQHDSLQPVVVAKVNEQLSSGTEGRLFAVIHTLSRQYLVKSEDVIVLRGYFDSDVGETIRFEKVLAVGGRDFSLIGRPLVPRDQVCVTGTVVEKTFSNTRVSLQAERRCRRRIFDFRRESYTYVRINNISIINKVDELPDVRGVDGKVFGTFNHQ